MELPTNDKIDRFWEWFSKAAPRLAVQDTELLEELKKQVTALGSVSWEIGPGATKNNSLVISPDGDATALEVTRAIVSRAPTYPEWEVHYAKPPKRWNLRFVLESSTGVRIGLDASTWKYVLYEFPNSSFDIEVMARDLLPLEPNLRATAVEIVLVGILGEEKRLRYIGGVDIVFDVKEASARARLGAMASLSEHLASILE